jgi:cyclic pyranopterin phosphate synthase
MTTCDPYRRPIDYLRISVTDRCNLRCVYCMPEEGVPPCRHTDILRYEEIEVVARAAAELGVHRVRITGGEPLARLGLTDLVRMLARVPGIDDLAMTTNGTLLAQHAQELAEAGLQRVNISLDTLRPERFAAITRRGHLADALAGIAAAHAAGLEPVKINSVIIRGLNDDEVEDLARRTLDPGWHLRFIEWMPVGGRALIGQNWRERVVTAAEIRAEVEAALGPLTPVEGDTGAGPARYYRLPGAEGRLGFIAAVSEHFCALCNRLRLTADGQLRPCLLAGVEIDLRTPLREGAGIAEIKALLRKAIHAKPRGHHLNENEGGGGRAMAQIGG